MLFASDLDQTLIYSPQSFRLDGQEPIPALQLVEVYEGRGISFITDTARQKLAELIKAVMFAPVTTRTIAQYQRITLFQEHIRPQFAVVSNGGNILVDGCVDMEWNRRIQAAMKERCLEREVVLRRFAEIWHSSWCSVEKTADDLFSYYLVDRTQLPAEALRDFTLWAELGGWQVSLQGRKLYLVPGVVNKKAALQHILGLLEEPVLAAAGDSLLDLCMLEQADYAFAPRHGEIWEQHAAGQQITAIQFTAKQGIMASEEILEQVIRIVETGRVARMAQA